MASSNSFATAVGNLFSTTKRYDKKSKADAAAKNASNESKAEAQKSSLKPYGDGGITDLQFRRTGTSGDNGVEIRFKAKMPAGQIENFTLDIEYQLSTDLLWRQLDNDYKTLDVDSQSDGWYTYNFDAPDDVNVCAMSVKVRPNSKSRDVKYTAYKSKKHGSGKNAYYTLVKTTATVSVAYFSATFCKAVKLGTPPALADSQETAAKLMVESPARPSKPTATLLTNGTIEVTFDAVDPETADTSRDVFRCDDGDYEHATTGSLSGHIDDENTARFVDQLVSPGHEYRYYVRAFNNRGTGTWDEAPSLPADLCDAVKTAPVEVEGLTAVGYGATGARVAFSYPDWAYFPALESVKVYYANDLEELVTNKTSCQSVDVTLGTPDMAVIVTGLTAGETWYFCPWLSTGSETQQERFCDSVASTTIATTPEAPTILDAPRAAYLGTRATVSWAHNCEDGCAQEQAQVVVNVTNADSSTFSETYEVDNEDSCEIYFDETKYSDLSAASVKVRTKGAAETWSPYSEDFTVDVYATPVLTASVTGGTAGESGVEISTLPLQLSLSASSTSGTLTQDVIQWTVTIRIAESGIFSDSYGNDVSVAANEVVSQKVMDYYDEDFAQPAQAVTISATEGVFIDGASYKLEASALMDSGLVVDASPVTFSCDFDTGMQAPWAMIVENYDWSVRIYPMLTDDEGAVDEGVLLSVYRIEPSGSMTPICEGYPNFDGVFCTDRHPAFGEMRYRIVANDQETDEITACDVNGRNEWSSILIQWDETVSPELSPDMEDDEIGFPFEWVELPWNITVEQSGAKDVAFKKYQGRKHPLALYGTQVGSTGSWSCEVIKDVEDWELAQLRKLQEHMGTCWVREPSGLSYPASVDVRISGSYSSKAVSVSLEVTRVDG